MRYLTVAEVIAINEMVVAERGQESILLDRNQLEANVGRPQWREDLWEAAGALFHGLAATQVFQDGNKGTALAATHDFLMWNGWDLDTADQDLYELAMAVALHRIESVEEVAAFLPPHCVPLKLPDLD